MTRIVKDVSTMNYFVTVSKQRITGSLAMQNISNPKPAANLEKHLLHSVSVTEIFMDSKHVFTGYRGILEWVPSRSIDYLKTLPKLSVRVMDPLSVYSISAHLGLTLSS